MPFQTPHLDKLKAVKENPKLPESDRLRIKKAEEHYHQWIDALDKVDGSPNDVLEKMVVLLNAYRNHIDVELIFDSEEDFLYRQKGQLKLDNSVIEEFLPRLIGHPVLLPELVPIDTRLGPTQSFSSAYFNSGLGRQMPGGGLSIKNKNQDFAIAKPLYIHASHHANFSDAATEQTYLSYVVAECKTNLDKTMFQEASATAHDLKSAVSGARYYLLCEWLDMSPQSTVPTDIDEVIILRKAKRLNANKRRHYSLAKQREESRDDYLAFLNSNPFKPEMFGRLIGHIRHLLQNESLQEPDILQLGYF